MSGVRRFVVHGRNTANLDRALGFYRDALGCRVIDMHGAVPRWARLLATMPARCAGLALGNERIELLEFAACTPYPALPAASDPWFQHCAIVVSDMEAAHRHVVDLGGVRITRGGPQLLPPGNGSVTAFKFRDPDGHPLELIAFPAGSGDPEWQARRKQAVTLGIDHSAICVADSARSIAFYELLGFRVVARTVNHGGAQERLDGLPGVEVEVIAMQASARTPHLELLAYPRPRRPTPPRPPPPARPSGELRRGDCDRCGQAHLAHGGRWRAAQGVAAIRLWELHPRNRPCRRGECGNAAGSRRASRRAPGSGEGQPA